MSATDTPKTTAEDPASPELQPGLVEALTAAYATLLKRQRTASAAYVRWTPAHSRAHEFAWFEAGYEALLTKGGDIVIDRESPVHSSIQKMMATMELNPMNVNYSTDTPMSSVSRTARVSELPC
jgi:hypothetical protein